MKSNSLRKRIILILFGLLVSIFLIETGMRLYGFILLNRQERFNKLISAKDVYTIMCLGESTTARGGENSYPAQLEEVLNEKKLGIRFNVINKGIEGIDSSSVLNCLKENLEKYKPDMVTVMMGVNDDCATILYEETLSFRIKLFFKKLRIYQLLEMIYLNLKERFSGAVTHRFYKDSNLNVNLGLSLAYAQDDNKKIENPEYTGVSPEQNSFEDNFKKLESKGSNIAGYINLGYKYFEEKEFGLAEEVFRKILDFSPSNRLALQGLARAYVKQGLFDEALEIFQRLLKEYPSWSSVLKDLGYTYNRMEEFEAAEEIFKKLIEIEPSNARVYRSLGYSYERRGLFAKAEEAYMRAVELSQGGEIKDFLALGEIYFKQEDYSISEEIYLKALEKDPDNREALEGLGISYVRQAEFKKAKNTFEKTLSLYPGSAKAYTGLGECYAQDNNFEEAERMFEKAIELEPLYTLPYHRLAYLYVPQELHWKAIRVLKKGIEVMPENYGFYSDMGGIYLILKKYPEAEEALEKGLEINSQYEPLYTYLGICYRRQGKTEKTKQLAKRIVNARVNSDRLYGFVANSLREQGRVEEARKYYKKASEYRLNYYNPSTRHNYRKLKEILDEKGIQLVCIQYPVREVKSLKKMFDNPGKIIFVDNEDVFKEALESGNYGDYFTDDFGGEFGHCTPKGNRLLAENIADTLIREYFKNMIDIGAFRP